MCALAMLFSRSGGLRPFAFWHILAMETIPGCWAARICAISRPRWDNCACRQQIEASSSASSEQMMEFIAADDSPCGLKSKNALGILNAAIRLHHPSVVDPSHRHPVLSAMYLTKKLIIPEYARKFAVVEHEAMRNFET